MHPNPSFSEIHFGKIIEKVVIRDVNARIVLDKSSVSLVNVSELVRGVYLVEITAGGTISSKKLIRL